MRVDAYIVINLDSGLLCVTTSEPGGKTLDGTEYFFQDSIVSMTAPGVTLDPISLSLESGDISIQIISEITPGEILNKSHRLCGCRARMWIEEEGGSILQRFDGQVGEVGFGLNEDSVQLSLIPKQDVSLLEYPQNNYFDEGRFVEKVTLNAVEEGGFTQEISVLRPVMEFQTIYGTPSSPNALTEFASQVIPLGDGDYDPGDLYLFFSDSASDDVIPIIYGTGKNVSVSPLGYYEVTYNATSYVNVYIYPLASHRIVGDESMVSDLVDFKVKVKWNDIFISNAFGYTVSDSLNGVVSYITLAVQYDDSARTEISDDAFEGFNPNEVYFESVTGKVGADGAAIRGLGDILFDMYQSSSSASASYIHWASTTPALESLNKYEGDIVINAKQEGQTLRSIFEDRLQQQFPVAVGSFGGKFAIQSSELPVDSDPVFSFHYGNQLCERLDLSQTSIDDVENEIRVQYAANGASSSNSNNVIRNRLNSEIARASFERWGMRPIVSLSIPDVQGASTAELVAEERLRRKGGVRIRVSYQMKEFSIVPLPLLSSVNITDEDVGFSDTPFYFVGYEWADDLTYVNAKFISVNMI
tara:strand:+ start:5005 stop:6762 length:1758 start_codon:yes stop_codon:yes gene_type:complete